MGEEKETRKPQEEDNALGTNIRAAYNIHRDLLWVHKLANHLNALLLFSRLASCNHCSMYLFLDKEKKKTPDIVLL